MVGVVRNRHRNEAPFPLDMDSMGIFEVFMQCMEHLGNQNNRLTSPPVALQPPPLRQTGDKLLEHFRALRLDKFDGMDEP